MIKYYLSLCCIIKDERYLEEFIVYYRILGVEHFYIYDNESSYSIKERLNKSYFRDFCTIINFSGKVQQLNSYHDCLKNYGHETEWLIFVDGDEYILPKKENHFSLRDFLNEYEDAHAVGINWVIFGTSFYNNKQNGFLVDKYRYCDSKQHPAIKTICKPRYAIRFGDPHYIHVVDPNKYYDAKREKINWYPGHLNNTSDIIQINHYSYKSVEEQYEKHKRGYPDQLGTFTPESNDKIHTIANDIKDDFLPNKYLHIIDSIFKEHNL
jgi:hypothetical protein